MVKFAVYFAPVLVMSTAASVPGSPVVTDPTVRPKPSTACRAAVAESAALVSEVFAAEAEDAAFVSEAFAAEADAEASEALCAAA